MKKVILPLVVFLLVLACGQPKVQSEDTKEVSNFPSLPDSLKLVSSDIDLFWQCFDRQLSDTAANHFEDYLAQGSLGVKDFVPERIESAKALKNLVLSEREYYQNIRLSSYKVEDLKKQITASFYALEYLYPEATYPPVYFLIGRTTSGGTATENGLMIALEVFSDDDYKTAYGRPSLDIELLPNVVIHEFIHFLQRDDENDESLLKHCIREGSADFIAELASGENTKLANGANVYPYGDQREKELWAEFSESMYSTTLSPWLYSETVDGRPQSLGYWMGYKIVEAYYEKAADKKKAIHAILNIYDYEEFLEQSGYATKFQ